MLLVQINLFLNLFLYLKKRRQKYQLFLHSVSESANFLVFRSIICSRPFFQLTLTKFIFCRTLYP